MLNPGFTTGDYAGEAQPAFTKTYSATSALASHGARLKKAAMPPLIEVSPGLQSIGHKSDETRFAAKQEPQTSRRSAMDNLGLDASDIESVIAALGYREREEIAAEAAAEAGAMATIAAAGEPSAEAVAAAERVSERAFKLIVDYETGGRAFYERIIKSRPIWPKEASGITIGFGYDLGYVSLDEYRRDWAAVIATLSAQQKSAMEACVGFHSGKDSASKMQSLLASVKDIVFSWDASQPVFKGKTLPKFAFLTDNALPNCKLLNGDCFGVLVSLTFNRGPSYSKQQTASETKDRYREMRAIKRDMAAKNFAAIPRHLKDMIRIWLGTAVETGLKRRRTDEANLFVAGLAAGLVSAAPAAVEVGAGVAEATVAAEANLHDDEEWFEVTEDDVTADALAGTMFTAAAAGAKWASDDVQPDYAHLGENLPTGLAFTLTGNDLTLLAKLNDFDVAAAGDAPVLFGLRGAGIVKDHTSQQGIVLIDQRPDHVLPRCVIGVWDRNAGKVSVFPGSTVPNQAAVAMFKNTQKAGNILPTGLYSYRCGPHTTRNQSTPGAFLLRNPDMSHRTVVVRRSRDDLIYQRSDMVHRCEPGDNIHPTFFIQPTAFSSLGCQTVVGTFKNGAHSGFWASFRTAAGFSAANGVPGKAFNYMLLTGAEARIASALRTGRMASDKIALRALRRLRFGSSGVSVEALQQQLGLSSPDGDFGPNTSVALHNLQRSMPGSNGSDGILTPEVHDAKGWQFFGAIGV
jgi:hypothetical protein